MNNLLGVSLRHFLGQPLIIVGLILLVLGVATVVLAKRIAKVSRQTNEVPNDDKVYVTLKVIGLLLMLAGFICVSVAIVSDIISRNP